MLSKIRSFVILSACLFASTGFSFDEKKLSFLETGTALDTVPNTSKPLPIFEWVFSVQATQLNRIARLNASYASVDAGKVKSKYLTFKKAELKKMRDWAKEVQKVPDTHALSVKDASDFASVASLGVMTDLLDEFNPEIKSTNSIFGGLTHNTLDCDTGTFLLADILSDLFPQVSFFAVQSWGHMSLGIGRVPNDKLRLEDIYVFETNPSVSSVGSHAFSISMPKVLNQKARKQKIYASDHHAHIQRVTQLDEKFVRSFAYMQYAADVNAANSLEARDFVNDMTSLALAEQHNFYFALYYEYVAKRKGRLSSERVAADETFRRALQGGAGISPSVLYDYGRVYNDDEAKKQALLLHEAIISDYRFADSIEHLRTTDGLLLSDDEVDYLKSSLP